MLVSKIKEEDLNLNIIDKLLFQGLEDTGEDVDCIIVLGSIKAAQYRVPMAVDVYNAGRSSKMMLCGGKLRDFSDGKYTEAEHMYKAVLEFGVAEENIILEKALIELQRTLWLNKVRKVLLVTTAYHMRRSLAIARYLFPEHIDIIPCPANDTSTRRENWMNATVGIQRAKDEAMKVVRYVTNGVIPDFEI